MDPLSEFREVLATESDALRAAAEKADERVVEAVACLYACRGRIAVVGMGKCGFIGRKIAATLASTGTPAFYLHPAEALHGDLGFVTGNDVALLLSQSGETDEVTELVPHLKRMGVKMIALTSGVHSTLSRYCDVVLDTSVDREACPLGMAPMASTTVMLATGDALAAVLMKKRGFTKEDYARCHPGGSLGQKLLCIVEELMHAGTDLPIVQEDVTMRDAIFEMTSKRLGAAFVVDGDGKLTGIITDGDLRRIFQRDQHPLEMPVKALMVRKPKSIEKDLLAVDALRKMEDSLITILPVVDSEEKPVGAIHIHDLIRAGLK